MKNIFLLVGALFTFSFLNAQVSGSLMQHPDVSDSQITFMYGDDIWIVSKTGGTANLLASPKGVERYPKFSPDGSMIAFTANYNGNSDVYIIPVNGGIPKRLTYHGMYDRVLGWSPDGNAVLFASSRESGRQRYSQFYTIDIKGGTPSKLAVPYGEYASLSPNGSKIAYTDRSRVNRNWKRYRGGTAPDITVFDLNSAESINITNNTANDELPMWVGNSVYYMSDNGPKKRNNLWKYDFAGKKNTQLTFFEDYDITFPENGADEIIFEAGGKLYLYNIGDGTSKEVGIDLVSDQKSLMARQEKVSSYLQSATVSPDGKRVVVQARGELFNVPATEGFVSNMTTSSGSAERNPEWSPDGKSVAYWSDATGEYQLMIHDMTGAKAPKKITNFSSGFNYGIYWSPDSKKIAYVDQTMSINYIDVTTGAIVKADKARYLFEGGLRNFSVSWSKDSNWFAYVRSTDNRATSAIFLYNISTNKVEQLTSGYYTDSNPVFSKDGKHLFFATNRTFNPMYSDLDNTFIYPNATVIAVGTLNVSEASILSVKNDKIEKPKKEEETKDADSKKKKSKTKDKEEDKDKEKEIKVTIDVEGFENRVELLDVAAGNINNLATTKGKLVFTRYPNSGASDDAKPSIDYYDFKERKVKTIISGVSNFQISANEKKMLVSQGRKLAVIDIGEKKKIDKTVPIQDMVMNVVPKEEWKQIFNDVWRLERDYFYDPGMHGVDWNLMKTRYGQLIDQANSRGDVNLIIGDLIAELNASHTYTGGGDQEQAASINVGYLGADVVLENGAFRIKKIISGAPWDVEVRSPLSKPGIKVKEGDYILKVNGSSIDASKPVSASFQGLANATVELTVNSTASLSNSRKVIVKLLRSESRLRHLAWIENNRKMVDQASNGKVGYIYVRSTGQDGQNELVRQFYAQMNKEGLIIDERFNSGGQIPDRFIELLDRDPLAFWAVRDGVDWAWPPAGNFGAKVMLINGFSGSGGDAFPDYFRKKGLGPLIGTRTWGGLIGITGAPNLIDNGAITMPTFRMYDPNGDWFKEGHGVDPDIEVLEDFQKLSKGIDVQLQRGIEEALKLINSNKNFKAPARPSYENRN